MTEEQIALARRAVACKGWRWMAGMVAYAPESSVKARVQSVDDDVLEVWFPKGACGVSWPSWLVGRSIPDLTDPAAPLRVRWIEDYTGPDARAKETRTWDGTVHGGEHYWCDRQGNASVPESRAIARGSAYDGTVLGFKAGTLLVVGDNGRIRTLNVNEVRGI